MSRGPDHYPRQLVGAVRLAGGSRATIRPTVPQDANLQRDFFRTLSAEDRYLRFMARLPGLTDEMAERFADIDHRRHLALLACVSAGGRETMIGEARCIVDKTPSIGDFAVAVAGGWQGLGLGRILLGRLITHAAASGISRLVADTLACNAGMIALAERCGFAVCVKREDRRLLHLVKDLQAEDALAPSEALPSWRYGMPLKTKANPNFHHEEERR